MTSSTGRGWENLARAFREAEAPLLGQLIDERSVEALRNLLDFYQQHRREDLVRWIVGWLLGTPDLERRALLFLYMGDSHKRAWDHEVAAEHYRQARALEPIDRFTSYFAHNNLAICLNLRPENVEAARLCRVAIQIDPSRPNAYKNLGISLAGQGDE